MLMLPAMLVLVYGGALLAVRFLSGHEHLRWMAGLRSKEGAKSRLTASEAPKRLAALARDSHCAQLFGANKI